MNQQSLVCVSCKAVCSGWQVHPGAPYYWTASFFSVSWNCFLLVSTYPHDFKLDFASEFILPQLQALASSPLTFSVEHFSVLERILSVCLLTGIEQRCTEPLKWWKNYILKYFWKLFTCARHTCHFRTWKDNVFLLNRDRKLCIGSPTPPSYLTSSNLVRSKQRPLKFEW